MSIIAKSKGTVKSAESKEKKRTPVKPELIEGSTSSSGSTTPDVATPSINKATIPKELRKLTQWVAWKTEVRDGEPTKVPYDPNTGKRAKTNDSSTWGTLKQAVASYEGGHAQGIGFVFSKNDPYTGVDLDKCRDPATGRVEEWAARIVEKLNSYTEVSPSGTGLHIIVRSDYELPRNRKGNFEAYAKSRYFTMTGETYGSNSKIQDRGKALQSVCAIVFEEKNRPEPQSKTSEALEVKQPLKKLEQRRRKDPKLDSLIKGEWETDYHSRSEADLALASKLISVVGKDPARIFAIIKDSGMYREKWERDDYRDATIQKAISEYNGPLPAGQSRPGREERAADQILCYVLQGIVELVHDAKRVGYAVIARDDSYEILKISGSRFAMWVRHQFFSKEQKGIPENALKEVVNTLEAKAVFEGRPSSIHHRVAREGKAIYYDLATDNGRVVKITRKGWSIRKKPKVYFRRLAHMKQQEKPKKGVSTKDISRIFEFVNIKDDANRLLFLVDLVACFVPGFPHPIQVIHGEHGSAKSTAFKIKKSLVDPSAAGTLSTKKNIEETVQALDHHWFCPFDNLSQISDDLSDILCRAVTGDSFTKRKLYTDDDDIIFSYKRCIGLNGINVMPTKPDLLDRSMLIKFEPIPDHRKVDEDELLKKFEAIRPELLGSIFDVLVEALKHYDKVELKRKPRMADFAKWGCAIALGLGYKQEEFMAALEANVRMQNRAALESNPVFEALLHFLTRNGPWEGTTTELLEELGNVADELKMDKTSRYSQWPKQPNRLSKKINEIRPNLRKEGWEMKDHPGRKKEFYKPRTAVKAEQLISQ